MIARDKDGKSKYERPILIPKYGKNLQNMPNGAAFILGNKKDETFLNETKTLYKKLIDEKILIIHGGTDVSNSKHT